MDRNKEGRDIGRKERKRKEELDNIKKEGKKKDRKTDGR
jgi:hypothetical protein